MGAVACLVVLVGIAAVLYLLPTRHAQSAQFPSAAPVAPAPTPVEGVSVPATGGEPASMAPADALQAQRTADRVNVVSAIGWWVPQISAKRVGTVAGGVVYDEAAIWSDFQASRSRFPNAVLLRSDDYGSFSIPGYWVTIVPVPYSDAASANAWCDSQGLGADDCFAKRIAYSPGASPDTVHR